MTEFRLDVETAMAALHGDPTRIDMDLDPIAERISGVAAHGNTPFDMPYISEIVPGLWQGGCRNGMRLPSDIKHLVSLYPWERYTHEHDLDSAIAVRMYDSTSQAFDQVDVLAAWVNVCRASAPTLVHCQAGLNRSSLVVARALMLDGMGASDAIHLIREKRSPACLCNESFEAWLTGIEA